MKTSGNRNGPSPAFLRAYAFTARWEGGFSDHPADAGGATRYGISLRLLQERELDLNGDGHIDPRDVRGLSDVDARSLYLLLFWEPMRCDELPLPLALTLFDGAVNMGQSRASRQLQKAMNESAVPLGQRLAEDGIIGAKTLALAETLDSLHLAVDAAQRAVRLRLAFYRSLCASKPEQKVFLRGWENRCAALTGALLELESGGTGGA